MDMQFKGNFIRLWQKYFNNAELPITFYYTDSEDRAEFVKPGLGARCIIGALAKIRKGESGAFGAESVGCPGGKKYMGFSGDLGALED